MVKAYMIQNRKEIIEKVKKTLIEASSKFRDDQKWIYSYLINSESNENAKWVMEKILENALIAEKNRSPLCDDTGIPHLFIDIGPNKTLNGNIISNIFEGVRDGLRELPGRPMAVLGNEMQRIDQSAGLDNDSGALLPAPIIIRPVKENIIKLHILMLGGGPAIRGRTFRIFHKHNVSVVRDEIVSWSKEAVGQLGCSPCALAIGIGRSQPEATSLMMEAMVDSNFTKQSDLENQITKLVNESQIGPLGLGGNTSVLASFIKIGPQRASGVRIVSLRPCCCFEPRKASVLL